MWLHLILGKEKDFFVVLSLKYLLRAHSEKAPHLQWSLRSYGRGGNYGNRATLEPIKYWQIQSQRFFTWSHGYPSYCQACFSNTPIKSEIRISPVKPSAKGQVIKHTKKWEIETMRNCNKVVDQENGVPFSRNFWESWSNSRRQRMCSQREGI